MREKIMAAVKALEKVGVCGRENMRAMFEIIGYLEALAMESEKEAKPDDHAV